MKRIFKMLLVTIVVFWGTIIILQAKQGVDQYVSKNKKEEKVLETTKFISKKGDGFVKYVMLEIDYMCSQIKVITKKIQENQNFTFRELDELGRRIARLKEIINKKQFIGLEEFIAKVTDFNVLINDYIDSLNEDLSKNNYFNIKIIEERQKDIENSKILIEELIKTIEVN